MQSGRSDLTPTAELRTFSDSIKTKQKESEQCCAGRAGQSWFMAAAQLEAYTPEVTCDTEAVDHWQGSL